MLKQLVQLFAEKFLVRKKEWVSNQSQALISGGTEIAFISSTDSQDYTAPCDGVICLDTLDATWTKLGSITNHRGYLLHSPNQTGIYKMLTLPVAKGETININISTDKSTIHIKFIPTIGS